MANVKNETSIKFPKSRRIFLLAGKKEKKKETLVVDGTRRVPSYLEQKEKRWSDRVVSRTHERFNYGTR